MPAVTPPLHFGRIVVEPGAREVRVDGLAVPLGRRAFDVLLVLIERRDRVVTKDELLALAWPGVVVEENNLQVQISALRRALGSGAIATVSGLGYRLTLEPQETAPEPPPPPRHGLPAQAASFVGREHDAAEILALLQRHRLVTLVGIGGIGKTRLALEAAARIGPELSSTACFVDLAPITDARLVADAVASALGIEPQSGASTLDLVRKRVAHTHCLVVLDNCEHLLEPCAQIAKVLLEAGPWVRILATSREALRMNAEATYPLSPLGVPGAQDALTPASLAAYDGVRLFVDRAQAALPGFALTVDNAAAVAAVCRALDGIPLALELAAARVRAMTPEAIAQRLGGRFRLLKDGDRTALPRQRTLRATLDWSHDLLSPTERALLRRLAVFAGSFSLEAAEAVCTGGDIDVDDVVEILCHLVDRSLVARDAGGERYRLFETVREYAAEHLAGAGEEQATRAAHVAFHADLAVRAGPALIGPDQAPWQRRLEFERENLLHATAFALAPGGDVEAVFAMLYGLRPWLVRSYLHQWHRIAAEALAHPAGQAPTLARANALYASAFFAYLIGRYEEGMQWCRDSLSIARDVGDLHAIGEAECQLGASLLASDPEEARAHFEAGLVVGRKLDDADILIYGYNGIGEAFAAQERWTSADASYGEALALSRKLASEYHIAITLLNVGRCSIALGNRARSIDLLRECAAHLEGTPPVQLVVGALELCAGLATSEGDVTMAARLLAAMHACCTRHAFHMEPAGLPFIACIAAAIDAHPDRPAIETAIAEGRALGDAAAVATARAWLDTLRP